MLSPVTVACLGSERRSCGSQTDLRSSDAEGSPFSSLINSSTSTMPPQSPEDISAYVKEMTATLATEIKSEIREVISKVDGLLSDNDVSSASPLKELKSECASRGGGTPPLLPLPEEAPTQSSECSSDETVIHVLRAEDARCGSSQDSGINLTSHESDSSSPGLADSCVRKRRKGETQPPTAASPQDPQQQPAFRWHCPPKAIWKPAVEVEFRTTTPKYLSKDNGKNLVKFSIIFRSNYIVFFNITSYSAGLHARKIILSILFLATYICDSFNILIYLDISRPCLNAPTIRCVFNLHKRVFVPANIRRND